MIMIFDAVGVKKDRFFMVANKSVMLVNDQSLKAVKTQYFRSLFDALAAIVNFKQIGF